MRAELADGRILEFPDGTDPRVIQTTVKRMLASSPKQPAPQTQISDVQPQQTGQDTSFAGMLEPVATIASSIVAEPIAGLAGLAQSLNPFAEEGAGAEAVESTREALTYMPRTEGGKEILSGVASVAEPIGGAISGLETSLGDFAFDLTGSPAIAAASASVPTMIGELLGLRSLKALRKGDKLLDATGKPTRLLRKELDRSGLDYDSLDIEVRKLIPEEVGPGLLPGAKPIRREVEGALIGQIKAGGRDDALATLKVMDGRLVSDRLGSGAIKQGFTPGFVQSIKTANNATKARMRKMLRIRKGIKGNERLALDRRPDIVIGDEVTARIGFIGKKADAARLKLDRIARNKLKGVNVDSTDVVETIKMHFDDLGIELKKGADGVPEPSFVNSLISEDPAAQKSIKALFRLMKKGGKPDALRFHNMKRELDNLINWQKSSSSGLTEAGRRVLKDVRRSLNDAVRNVDTDYAQVNDILSSSIDAIKELDKSVGSIDILADSANKALGTRMRALMSNQQGRIKIENALDSIDSLVEKFGGKFDADIKDLVLFDNTLNKKFGAIAETGFAGQIEQAVGRAATQPPKASVIDAVGRGLGKGAEKLRGVNDFNSFEAIDALLR